MQSKVKKSIAIIGEGETEWFYFESLRTYHRYSFKIAPDFPSHSDIESILKLASQYLDEKYDYVICLIDMDKIKSNSTELKKYNRLKKKREYKNIMFIETYLCTEYWFLLHFIPNLSTRVYTSQEDLIKELQRYMPGYEKTKKYFRKINLYCHLIENGDIQKAIKYSEQIDDIRKENPDDDIPYSEIYKVIKLLNELEPMKS